MARYKPGRHPGGFSKLPRKVVRMPSIESETDSDVAEDQYEPSSEMTPIPEPAESPPQHVQPLPSTSLPIISPASSVSQLREMSVEVVNEGFREPLKQPKEKEMGSLDVVLGLKSRGSGEGVDLMKDATYKLLLVSLFEWFRLIFID